MYEIWKIARTTAPLIALVGLFSCTVDGCRCTVRVRNQTPYFVHLLTPEEIWLYVAPSEVKALKADEKPAELQALIAPGQGVNAQCATSFACDSSSCEVIELYFENRSLHMRLDSSGCQDEGGSDLD
ncbi:MAG: hypothetical protein JXR96_12975 [Deltaproteobacteria bacterium]|nr:hypothetical protein [Deltaproteobacteria bacterium]